MSISRQILVKASSLTNSTKSTISSDDDESRSFIPDTNDEVSLLGTNNSNISLINLDFPFSRTRLNQWHSNEEIFAILTKCSYLFSLKASTNRNVDERNRAAKLLNEWLSDECVSRPLNGSVFLFDRRRVKNFKKDAYSWKRRKTGGANSVREDRMNLKINGSDKIYGCYSHSSIISTFHRRCYWLLDKPDLVLVHYLHTPNSETGECVINLSGAGKL